MKPFNLEEAKAGKPACTRDGRDVRIICWDKKGARPLVALVDECDGEQVCVCYMKDGTERVNLCEYDLFMKSTTEKRWAIYYDGEFCLYNGRSIFFSYNKALKHLLDSSHKIIEFEIEV